MTTETDLQNREIAVRAYNGWTMLVVLILLLIADIGLFVYCADQGSLGNQNVLLSVFSVVMIPVLIFLMTGLFTLQPNQARVLVLFGKYRGTVRESGIPTDREADRLVGWPRLSASWKQPNPERNTNEVLPETKFRCARGLLTGKSSK